MATNGQMLYDQYGISVAGNMIYITFNGRLYVGTSQTPTSFLGSRMVLPLKILSQDQIVLSTSDGTTSVSCLELSKSRSIQN